MQGDSHSAKLFVHEHHFVQVGSDVIGVRSSFLHHFPVEVHLDHVPLPIELCDDGSPHVSNALGMLDAYKE